jgi:hypothetical protein
MTETLDELVTRGRRLEDLEAIRRSDYQSRSSGTWNLA